MAKSDRPEDHPEVFEYNLFEIPAREAREAKEKEEKERKK